jgi:hypothetical protein
MPSEIMKSFGAIALTIIWMDEKQISIPEVWTSFFLVSHKLYEIKQGPEFKKSIKPFPSEAKNDKSISTSPMSQSTKGIYSLPNELLYAIVKYLPQSDLYQGSLVSKQWHRVINPILYKNPSVSSVQSLYHLVKLSENTGHFNWSFKDMVQEVHFAPCQSGSLLGGEKVTGIENILNSHSCLYRMIVLDRHLYPGTHPIFMDLIRSFSNLKNIVEIHNNTDESPQINFLRRVPRVGHSMSDYILSRLIKYSKRMQDMKEWSCIDFNKIQSICIFLLDLFESGTTLAKLMPQAAKKAKTPLLHKIKSVLNCLSGSLLLQVQYVTLSSQKLLDAYCLIYYEALDVSNMLNLDRLASIFEKKKAEDYGYQKEADCIEKCLQLLFHKDSESSEPMDFEKIRHGITSFPPSGVNKETCKRIRQFIDR